LSILINELPTDRAVIDIGVTRENISPLRVSICRSFRRASVTLLLTLAAITHTCAAGI
jgi:hypothetical protein